MDPNGILLITITVLVSFLTIGVWGILFALVRSRSVANGERSAAIRSIAEECAEADKLLSSSAATAMSAHNLRSALVPKIEKIRKILTLNMCILDVYFVKYTESRLSVFQSAFAASEALAHDLRSRVEAMPVSMTPIETVLVKEKEESVEPPAIDLRTGIITVAQEEPKQVKHAEKRPAGAKAEAKPAAVPVKKTPVLAPKKKPAQPLPAAEEVFDFEKEMAARPDHTVQIDSGHGTLHTEKTMKWDRDELKGLAADKPESIVVEGTEQARAGAKPAGTGVAPQPDTKSDEVMISGEDIENTLDSFFGLDNK